MSDLDRFNKFVTEMRKHYPKLRIAYKDESWLMLILSKVLFFNKNFATQYITTIGNTVYFPNRKGVEYNPINAMLTLAHECVHIRDSIKFSPLLFSLIYLVPQLFALLIIPAFFIIGWWALLFLLFLAPIPSPGRMYLEYRGYTMSLFALNKRLRELNFSNEYRLSKLKEVATEIDNKHFSGSSYYFMWPFGMTAKFALAIKDIESGDILDTDEVFRLVDAALESSKS